jgi:hypothetical protein
MNINEFNSTPTMFQDLKSQYALCDQNDNIVQVYTQLSSAKYMLTEYNMGNKIYEIVKDKKGKIISNLGEICE